MAGAHKQEDQHKQSQDQAAENLLSLDLHCGMQSGTTGRNLAADCRNM